MLSLVQAQHLHVVCTDVQYSEGLYTVETLVKSDSAVVLVYHVATQQWVGDPGSAVVYKQWQKPTYILEQGESYMILYYSWEKTVKYVKEIYIDSPSYNRYSYE